MSGWNLNVFAVQYSVWDKQDKDRNDFSDVTILLPITIIIRDPQLLRSIPNDLSLVMDAGVMGRVVIEASIHTASTVTLSLLYFI